MRRRASRRRSAPALWLLALSAFAASACSDKAGGDSGGAARGDTSETAGPDDTSAPDDTALTDDTAPPTETGCAETTGALSGTVRISELKPDPKPDARVTARGPDDLSIETLTDDDGVYRFAALPAGDWAMDAVNVFGDCSNSRGYTVTIEPCGSYVVDIDVDACFGR